MYIFWESVLFATVKFDGNPMGAHYQLMKWLLWKTSLKLGCAFGKKT